MIQLYAGQQSGSPGSFRGGEVELSSDVVAQGLEDMETDYMAGYAERAGGTFDGKCFLVPHDTAEGHFKQQVLCGPVHLPSGEVRWLGTPITMRTEGEDVVGFEHAMRMTVLRSESGPPTANVAAALVRPDGAEPDLSSDGMPSATTTEPPEDESPLSDQRWTEGPEEDLGGDEIEAPDTIDGSEDEGSTGPFPDDGSTGGSVDGHEGTWTVADLDVERLPDSTTAWGGFSVGGELDATDEYEGELAPQSSTFALADGQCPAVDDERIVLGSTDDERWITMTRGTTCNASKLPADVRRDDGERLQVCWDDSRYGRGCVILDRT